MSEIRKVHNEDIVSWQDSMRAALYDGMSAGDVVDIVNSIKNKAKQGNIPAAEFLFKWVIGNPTIQVQNAAIMVAERKSPSQTEIRERALEIKNERMMGNGKKY